MGLSCHLSNKKKKQVLNVILICRSRSRWSCQVTDDGLKQLSKAKCIGNLSSISMWGSTAITDKGVVQLVVSSITTYSTIASVLLTTYLSCRFLELLLCITSTLVVRLLQMHLYLPLQIAVLISR